MQHPNPIGSGLGKEAIVEAAGPDCIVPGQIVPIKLLGLKVFFLFLLVTKYLLLATFPFSVLNYIYKRRENIIYKQTGPTLSWDNLPLLILISFKGINFLFFI